MKQHRVKLNEQEVESIITASNKKLTKTNNKNNHFTVMLIKESYFEKKTNIKFSEGNLFIENCNRLGSALSINPF